MINAKVLRWERVWHLRKRSQSGWGGVVKKVSWEWELPEPGSMFCRALDLNCRVMGSHWEGLEKERALSDRYF